jgi:hypothetical protein
MIFKRILAALLSGAMLFGLSGCFANDTGINTSSEAVAAQEAVHTDDSFSGTGFALISTRDSVDLGGTLYHYRHHKTGAEVVYLDNSAEHREFSIGFKTPPADSAGANHVLEHMVGPRAVGWRRLEADGKLPAFLAVIKVYNLRAGFAMSIMI